jgi:protein-S-isoprenylcysteine O-methyltransferase Ste14
MALQQEMESAGNWLFRRRSYLPIVMIGLFLAGLRDFRYPADRLDLYRAWGLLCLAVSVVGMAVRVVAVGHAPARTSGKNSRQQVAAELNCTGLYSVVRHPLYLGNYLITLGLALFPRSWWVALVASLLFILYYERIMLAEEAFLRREFGDDYAAWADRTPAFLPDFRLWRKAALPFSLRSVVRREYGAFFATVASFVLLDVAAGFAVHGRLECDRVWAIAGAAAAVVYAAARLLAKFTSVLDVEGR